MNKDSKLVLIAFLASISLCSLAQGSETVLKIPASVISGSGSYTVDILTPEYWSAGLPTSSSTVSIQLDEGSKTPYAISSGEVNLEHLKVESKDFYLRSDYPLIFNSETSSVVTCSSTSYGLKIDAPAIFNADVIYNSSASLRWLKPFTAKGDFDLTENSGRKVLTVVGARGSEVKGVLKGTYNAASSANTPGVSVVAISCQIANMAQVSFNDVSSFGGSYWLNFGGINLSCAANSEDVIPSLPSEGKVLHFDASDDSTFTFEKGGLVKEWRDKVTGRKLYPAIDGRYPVRRANALGSLPVVDFLGHTLFGKATGAPLRLSDGEIVTTAKSAFWVIGSQQGGGWIFGSKTDSRIFHRAGTTSQGDYPTAPLSHLSYAGNKNARFYKNGKLFDASKEGLSGNWDVLSVVDSTAFTRGISGFAFDHLGNVNSARSGYMELAEFIAYETELDEASRKQVEEYLKRKWLNGREDLQQVVVKNIGEISTTASGADCSEKHLNKLYMRGELVKDGGGTLVLDNPRDIESAVIVKDGTLKIENNDNAAFFSGMEAKAPSSEGLILHLDASDESTIDVEGGYVKAWRSLVGDNGLGPRSGAEKPFMSNTDGGKKIVDFGHFKSKRVMDLFSRITNAKTVIMTLNARNGGGHLLGDTADGGGTSFHRGSSIDETYHTTYDTGSPIFNMSASSVLESWVDGEVVSAWKESLPSRITTCAFRRIDSNNLTIGTIGCDRGNIDLRSGGLQVAELLVYSRQLSQVEIVEATAYLNQKWKTPGRPVLAGIDVKGDDTALKTMCDTSMGIISGDGHIAATGSGTVQVGGFERGWSGALSSTAGAWNIRHDKGIAPSEPVKTGLIGWYDPSDASTVTLNDNGEVTELASKVENSSSFKSCSFAYLPTMAASQEVGGRKLIDCGSKYSNKGLVLDADFSNAMSVVMVYDPYDGGGQLFGARKENQAFQRDISVHNVSIFNNVASCNTVLKYANVWIDGVPRGVGASGMKKGCQIISFTAPGPFYLGMIGARETTGKGGGGGGQRYGEILIYDHVLTDEERSSTEAYLAAKWWGEPMAGYTVDGKPNMPGQQSDSSVALTVPSEETLSVGYLAGEGGVVKTGSGTLELMGSTSELSGDIDIREGTVKYTVRTLDVDTLPVTGGLLAHFDASDESSFIKNANGGVIGWKAKAAAAKYGELVAESYFKDSSGNPRAGTYLANELNGRGVLDCGKYGNSGVGFVFPETISNVNHVVMVFGSQNGGGFILGEINDGVSNEIWHREYPYNDISSAVFNYNGRGVDLYVEGVKKDDVTEMNVLNGGYQILEASLQPWAANKSVSGFGLDRITFPDRAGGQRYAEVMIYDHVLSAEERLALLIYLNNRWRNANYVGSGVFDAMYLDRANAGRVTVADGATFDLNGFTQTTEMLGGSGTIKGGNVVVTDEVLASFGDDALSVEGTLTFSGAGAIVFPADWTGGYGRWKLFSATKIEGNVRDWVGTGIVNGKEYNAKLSVSGNTVYLNINSPGTEIIIR